MIIDMRWSARGAQTSLKKCRLDSGVDWLSSSMVSFTPWLDVSDYEDWRPKEQV